MKTFTLLLFSILTISLAAQDEMLTVEGAIKLDDTAINQDGVIKYTGNDLEGRVDGDWESLTRPFTKYTETNNMNNASYNLNDQNWTPIGPSRTVVKEKDYTTLDLEFAGYLSATSMPTGGFGIRFELRIDGLNPNHQILASLKPADLLEFCHMRSVYTNLPAGTYTMRMYAQTPNSGATATGVLIDSGGWGASIICKEQ